jgi:hypothetical protein
MSTTTLQPVFLEPGLESQAHMAGKSAEESVFDQMKVPPWGRLLIKTLLWALIPLFVSIGGALWKLNHDVGVIEGQLKNLLQTLSTSLLDQANQLTKEGKMDEALGAVKLATAAITSASQKNIPANPRYFTEAIHNINLIQSAVKTPSAMESLHVARVQLANYRSALKAPPPLPNFPIDKITSTVKLTPIPGKGFTFLDMGNWILDGSKLPPGSDFYSVAPNNTEVIRTSIQWFMNGSQTLDGIQWTDVTFIHTRIKYFGGRLDLHNDRFIGCPFEIVSDVNGDKLADAIAQEFPSFTSSDQPAIHFHDLTQHPYP